MIFFPNYSLYSLAAIKTCHSKWVYIRGSCYLFEKKNKLSWHSAEVRIFLYYFFMKTRHRGKMDIFNLRNIPDTETHSKNSCQSKIKWLQKVDWLRNIQWHLRCSLYLQIKKDLHVHWVISQLRIIDFRTCNYVGTHDFPNKLTVRLPIILFAAVDHWSVADGSSMHHTDMFNL